VLGRTVLGRTVARVRRPRSLRSVYGRSLREERRALVGWSLGLAGYLLVMLVLYPTIHGNQSFEKLVRSYPEALRKIFGLADFTSGAGYLRTEVFSFMVPLLLAVFAILWGSDLVAGEEERGTLDLLLAAPVTRRRVLVQKWLALLTGVGLLVAALEVLIGLLGPLFQLHVGWVPLTAALLGSGLFAAVFGTLALALGAAAGSRSVARGAATALAVAMYLLSTLAQLVTWLGPVRGASLWYHALGTDPLGTGLHVVHLAVLVAAVGALGALGVVAFDRRDIAT